jgi:hypothetical protein
LVGRGSASHTAFAHHRWWYPHLTLLVFAGLPYSCAAVAQTGRIGLRRPVGNC